MCSEEPDLARTDLNGLLERSKRITAVLASQFSDAESLNAHLKIGAMIGDLQPDLMDSFGRHSTFTWIGP